MITIAHLFPQQLGLNGEVGNVTAISKRLEWSGFESRVHQVSQLEDFPSESSFVFIGSGTVAGQLSVLSSLTAMKEKLFELSQSGVPILAVGAGWELLGKSLEIADGTKIQTLGLFPSIAKHVSVRASCESYGFDFQGNLTTGYSNHSSEIALDSGVSPLVNLLVGNGNSSISPAKVRSDEGLVQGNLIASRLNGPLLPINPHLADYILNLGLKRLGLEYKSSTPESKIADDYAAKAREGIEKRLAR